MTGDQKRQAALADIRRNIAEHGHHTYIVTGGACPRYGYTIGLTESHGAELVMAGAYFYRFEEFGQIISRIVRNLRSRAEWETCKLDFGVWGRFSLRNVDVKWISSLMLGATDFYRGKTLKAYQIVPDEVHRTIEIPDLSEPWNPKSGPAWRWLFEDWTYPIPRKSVAITNLGALRGERITEAARWEDDEWELFSGPVPDIPEDERRIAPIGVLLAADESLQPVVNLPIGGALWRNGTSEWHPWGKGRTLADPQR